MIVAIIVAIIVSIAVPIAIAIAVAVAVAITISVLRSHGSMCLWVQCAVDFLVQNAVPMYVG